MNVLNIQQRIAEVADERPEACFTALNHYIDKDWMKEACSRLRKASAPGVDGQSVASYGVNLESNLRDLIDRIKSGRYVATAGEAGPHPQRRRQGNPADRSAGRRG